MDRQDNSPGTAQADAQRKRFRQRQIIDAQKVRTRAAGRLPSEDEAARLVAEFHARGGQVTVSPLVEDEPTSGQRQANEAR